MNFVDYNDRLIVIVASALEAGATIEDIHDALIKKNWSESDIYLLIKAGSILYKDRGLVSNPTRR